MRPAARAGGRERDPGARAELTGDYAGNLDFSSRLSNVTPIVIAFVLGAGVHPAGRDLRLRRGWRCR